MILKEKISVDYLFFRKPTNHFLILGPLFVATSVAFFSDSSFVLTEGVVDEIPKNQNDLVTDFLVIFKISFIMLSSFYLTYRWALIEKDGNLGYWITQGVNKNKFFLLTFVHFYSHALIGLIIGLILVMFAFGLIISNSLILKLLLSISISYMLVIVFSIFTAEIIKNPEIALMSNIGAYLILFVLLNQDLFVGGKIMFAELEYYKSDYLTWIAFSVIANLVLYLITYLMYLRRDIEL